MSWARAKATRTTTAACMSRLLTVPPREYEWPTVVRHARGMELSNDAARVMHSSCLLAADGGELSNGFSGFRFADPGLRQERAIPACHSGNDRTIRQDRSAAEPAPRPRSSVRGAGPGWAR